MTSATPDSDPRTAGWQPRRGGAAERSTWINQARTPSEFRAMLRALKDETGMSFAHLAIRAGWSRSGLHKATTDATTMPARDLVHDFIQACRVSSIQADLVMEMWDRITAAIRAEEDREVVGHGNGPSSAVGGTVNPTTSTRADVEGVLDELRHAQGSAAGDFYV